VRVLLLLLLFRDARQRNIAVPFIYYLRLSWPYLEFRVSVQYCRKLLNTAATTVCADDLRVVLSARTCDKNEGMLTHKHILSAGLSKALVRTQYHLWVGYVNNVGCFWLQAHSIGLFVKCICSWRHAPEFKFLVRNAITLEKFHEIILCYSARNDLSLANKQQFKEILI
jgi:hypothetical protein